ncbi:Site-specific recombinase, phage integrase family [Hyphomicrobium sulfonivorans]|uniref:Site-specific recombinase, phage integrase family n=1 Tax=Hyphomicrobium sulfonivorans TaxID=121290 RepID=A0A120CX19_HYPSL|nr:hypothetical protein [Hyphomicrobium sulfonivorans]KWT70257.1 Site-specific recombinase, phage integrase family [Hyphomicrobium sulfonivorans]
MVSKPHEEILRRIDAVTAAGAVNNTKAVTATLGGARKGQTALSALVDEYEALQKLHLSKHSPDQIRKWRNLRERAVNDLMIALGRDVYKCIGAISAMIEALDSAKRLKLDLVLKNLRLKGGSYEPRAAYSIDFVQDRILADGALDSMNPEARRVVYVCAELGLRPVEVVNLTKNSIRLDAKIPHIIVQPEGRVLKTDHSERHVPLVGVALKAMRLQPEGFPEYFDKSATLSATVNKFMANNGLRPFPKVSLYSLRHTFEDRLTKIEPPEKIHAYLMGHKYDRPKYGSPPDLEQLVGWMEKIAFRPPASPI